MTTYDDTIEDDFTAESAVVDEGILGDVVEDELSSLDESGGVIARVSVVEETLTVYDTLSWGWHVEAASELQFADAILNVLAIPIDEVLGLFDSIVTGWKGVEVVEDTFAANDFAAVGKVFFDTIAESVTLDDAPAVVLELLLIESLLLSASAIVNGKYQHNIEEFLSLLDEATRGFFLEIADSLTIADAQLITYVANAVLQDSVTVTDATSDEVELNETVADSLSVVDAVTVMQRLHELILDGFELSVAVDLDGEVYECWVLNTDDFHPSVYSGFNFNSFAVQNGALFAANATGIYKIEGDADAGTEFHSGVVFPEVDFGVPNKKRLRVAWFGMNGNTAVLRTSTENGTRTYAITGAKVFCNRDVHGSKWTLSLQDFDTLNSIDLLPVLLYKR
jgi:hypothetical protein